MGNDPQKEKGAKRFFNGFCAEERRRALFCGEKGNPFEGVIFLRGRNFRKILLWKKKEVPHN